MKKSQIFTRTFSVAMAIMASLLVILHTIIYGLLPHFYLENTKDELTKKADAVTQALNGFDEASVKNYLKVYQQNESISISVRTQNDSVDVLDIKNELAVDKASSDNSVFIEIRTVRLNDNKELILEFISSRNARKDAENLTLNFLPYSLAVGLVFSIIFAYMSSKIIVKPLIEAEKIASDVERAKSTFLSSASHELKTPLSGLRITLENMQYEVGEYRDHKKYLGESIKIVDKMATMISEILNTSSYQDWLKKPEQIAIKRELPKIIKDYRPLILAKKLKLEIRLDREKIRLAKPAFQKLFSNLISNAVKYADDNSTILITCRNHWLRIENQCQPIRRQDVSALFNIFEHGENNGGTGIGLFVVKSILEHYGIKYQFSPTKTGVAFKIKLDWQK